MRASERNEERETNAKGRIWADSPAQARPRNSVRVADLPSVRGLPPNHLNLERVTLSSRIQTSTQQQIPVLSQKTTRYRGSVLPIQWVPYLWAFAVAQGVRWMVRRPARQADGTPSDRPLAVYPNDLQRSNVFGEGAATQRESPHTENREEIRLLGGASKVSSRSSPAGSRDGRRRPDFASVEEMTRLNYHALVDGRKPASQGRRFGTGMSSEEG